MPNPIAKHAHSLADLPGVLADKVTIGGGEGYDISTATLDGRPCVIANSGTMAGFFDDEDDSGIDFVTVYMFNTAADRDEYVRERGWANDKSWGS